MSEYIEEIENMCLLTDELAKCVIKPNTPLYNFQQGMIENVKLYREKNKEKENESSS